MEEVDLVVLVPLSSLESCLDNNVCSVQSELNKEDLICVRFMEVYSSTVVSNVLEITEQRTSQ